jgi:hypothetical protein
MNSSEPVGPGSAEPTADVMFDGLADRKRVGMGNRRLDKTELIVGSGAEVGAATREGTSV